MTYPPTHVQLCCMIMIRICLTEPLGILSQVSLEARVKHVRTVVYLGGRSLIYMMLSRPLASPL
jgi:hypothetical protein